MVESNIVGVTGFGIGGIQNFDNDDKGLDNYAEGNFVRLTSDGRSIADADDGVRLDDTIGAISTNSVACNTIAFDGETSVKPGAGVGNDNPIYGNSIHSIGSIGINLSPFRITLNDADDGDCGPNRLQNYPKILSATINTV